MPILFVLFNVDFVQICNTSEGIHYLYMTSSSSKYEPSLSTRLIGSECVCDLWSVGVQETNGKFTVGCVQLVKDKHQYRRLVGDAKDTFLEGVQAG